ncbi:HipA family kinase, partial [Listeria monocytogenes]
MFITIDVENILEKVGIGSTNPFKVKASDGKIYVIKIKNDACDGKTLLNELIAYRLAKLLDLPISNCCLINLKKEHIEDNIFNMDGINCVEGIGFASEYMQGNTRINAGMLKSIINAEDIPSIILFDQIILNTDRSENDGNLYYDKRTKKLMIIDHSHIFGGWSTWNVHQIRALIKEPPAVINNLVGKNYHFFIPYVSGHSPFNKITKKIDHLAGEIDGLFEDIPIEWSIDEEEIAVTKKFIRYQ